jgi:D-alanyl-D-alanine carboxypeptidase
VKYFLKEMNANAAKLKMFSSCFDSPHGLMNKFNYSTAYDVCLLTSSCMQIPLFREVVKTQLYTTSPLNGEKDGFTYIWENTNKLLGTVPGFVGAKTGITDSAGPCFSGCFHSQGESICVVVLNSKSMEQRWVEVPQMAQWAIRRKAIAKKQNKRTISTGFFAMP